MRTTSTAHKRTRCYSKTVPKTRRVSKKETGVGKPYSMRNRFPKRKTSGYRSQFELGLALSLKERNVEFEYETKKLTYIPDPKTYTPDFYLVETDIYVEAKGELTKADRVKMILVKKQHPDLDIRFVFMNSKNKIYRGSKTTYAAWCIRHGFQWADKNIPSEWLRKDGSKDD